VAISGAAFGASGSLYCVGGQADTTEDLLFSSIECFDPRKMRWTVLPQSEANGIMRVDLSLVYSLV